MSRLTNHNKHLAAIRAALLAWRKLNADAVPPTWIEAIENQLTLNNSFAELAVNAAAIEEDAARGAT